MHGGGPQPHHHHATKHQLAHELGGGRLEHAARHACHPPILPSAIAILGGGPVAPCAPHGTPTLPQDPTLAAFAAWTGTDVQHARTSLRQQLSQLAGQLTQLLAAGAERLSALLPARGDATATSAATPLADAPANATDVRAVPMPMQPPAPPMGPTLTLDPNTGTIDVPDGPLPVAPGHLPDDHGSGEHRETPPIEFGIPSAWMPYVGRLRPSSIRRDLRSLMERIDALLSETGVSRMQLLAAIIAVPIATAFLIDVVATILDGR